MARRSVQLALLLLLGATVALAAGCGGAANANKDGADSPDAQSAALKFSHCMRQHGIHMSDPDSTGAIRVTSRARGSAMGRHAFGGGPSSDPKFAAASKACKKWAPKFRPSDSQQAGFMRKQLEQALKFSRCVRAHGVPNWPDPKQNGTSLMVGGPGINPNDPAVRTATKACQKYMGGPGPAGDGPSIGTGSAH